MSTAEISEIRHPWDVVGGARHGAEPMVDGADRHGPFGPGSTATQPGGLPPPVYEAAEAPLVTPHSEVVVSLFVVSSGPLVVVAGALANKPCNGGEAWVRMTWVRGLQRLGCRVGFVEQIAEGNCVDTSGRPVALGASRNRQWFETVTSEFGLGGMSSLLSDSGATVGLDAHEVCDLAAEADLLVNISGNLQIDSVRRAFARSAFVDIDPGFTQLWRSQGATGAGLEGHDRYFTVGVNIGSAQCRIPTGDLGWRPLLPPVVLEDWPLAEVATPSHARFTTVATWRGPYGPIRWDRRRFGLRVHEFRKFMTLPDLVDGRFEAALAIHASEKADLQHLARHHWHLVDPHEVAGTPEGFRSYVAGSDAEFSVAQEMYVASCSGWFSDRTTRYLASGHPALVQDTGFSRHVPAEKGLVAFSTLDEAVAGAASILADYPAHAVAARAVAEEYFDSDKVLAGFLEACDVP